MDLAAISKTILIQCAERFPSSLERYEEALKVFPSGVTHDSRHFKPFPIYISHADGPYKTCIDGNELIDYWMGHGALLLGHNPPSIVRAVTEQMTRGTHYGASHELEITWGQWVQRLVPSAERVRFVNSGTEATMLAMRLARAFTGKNNIIRFQGHFHGWHDSVMIGYKTPYDIPCSMGIPAIGQFNIKALPPNNIAIIENELSEDSDIAAVILEPAGGSNAVLPTKKGFLTKLRDLCTTHCVILIFDEVITGFRYAPGGAQEYFKVTPDITCLGKILAGGLPGGAVAGRSDIMDMIAFKGDPHANRHNRVLHTGTFNANPLSAAAGIAMLEKAATGNPQIKASELTEKLIVGMNEILRSERLPGCVYGGPGGFHMFVGQKDCQPDDANRILDTVSPSRLMEGMGFLMWPLRAALLLEGVDIHRGGRLSSAHTNDDIERTLVAFEASIGRLRHWDLL